MRFNRIARAALPGSLAAGIVAGGFGIVLFPPSAAAEEKVVAKRDIVETAVVAGQFKTLAAALQAAGLVDTPKGAGPFTVFAPTDDAFAKLPKGTVEDLLKPENKQKLTQILTYHVVPGKVTAKEVTGMKSDKTVNGKEVRIDAKTAR